MRSHFRRAARPRGTAFRFALAGTAALCGAGVVAQGAAAFSVQAISGGMATRGTVVANYGGTQDYIDGGATPAVQFSAAVNCNPALSTKPMIVKWGSHTFRKTAYNSISCQTSTPTSTWGPAPYGFNQTGGSAIGLLDGAPATASFTMFPAINGRPYAFFFIYKAPFVQQLSVNVNDFTPLNGTPGGVWFIAPPHTVLVRHHR